MSKDRDAQAGGAQGPVDAVIVPRTSDLGDGFTVRRALPSTRRRMVGPFIFFDQMGPATFDSGRGLDVRPHPHIGLATVTYLFAGEVMHRDSLGTTQAIRPGEVNWMTAGRGIAHSERTPADARRAPSQLAGIQTWLALPVRHEETEPAFVHYAADAVPTVEGDGARMRLIAGALHGARSPVATHGETLYAELRLASGAQFELPASYEERAIYVVAGAIELRGDDGRFDAGQLVVLRPGASVVLRAGGAAAHAMVLGGAAMDGPRHLWWNFVGTSAERIAEAAADWRAGRFAPVPDEHEFIPLPDAPPLPVGYP